MNCIPLVLFLKNSLKDEPKYKHKVVENPEKLVAFRRITSNITQVVSVLDDLRREPKKFLCLNDNTDPDEETSNKMVHAVLVDYLESVLPVPSSFELPLDYRNKFLHTFELARWQLYRSVLTVITYLCILFLIVIVIAGTNIQFSPCHEILSSNDINTNIKNHVYFLGYYKIDIDSKVITFGKYIANWTKPSWDTNQEYVIIRNPKDYNTV